MQSARRLCNLQARAAQAAELRPAAAGTRTAPSAAMLDLFFVLGTVAFFALSWAYVRYCEAMP